MVLVVPKQHYAQRSHQVKSKHQLLVKNSSQNHQPQLCVLMGELVRQNWQIAHPQSLALLVPPSVPLITLVKPLPAQLPLHQLIQVTILYYRPNHPHPVHLPNSVVQLVLVFKTSYSVHQSQHVHQHHQSCVLI